MKKIVLILAALLLVAGCQYMPKPSTLKGAKRVPINKTVMAPASGDIK